MTESDLAGDDGPAGQKAVCTWEKTRAVIECALPALGRTYNYSENRLKCNDESSGHWTRGSLQHSGRRLADRVLTDSVNEHYFGTVLLCCELQQALMRPFPAMQELNSHRTRQVFRATYVIVLH